ncbi:MAG: RtcB family protein [Candidatus Diapherotrites archaeon]|nr:RtcB family protein [Candidatus Diapherotrites archaeon]
MKKVREGIWELEGKDLQVPARVVGTEKLVNSIEEGALQQIKNVTTLPGIVKHAIAMPDIHWGYGFPIGGVAAMDAKTGVISPGGIGFDINCGIRMLRTNLTEEDIRPKLNELVREIFNNVPAGLGGKSKLRLTKEELDEACVRGSEWAIENGYGWKEDLERTEDYGRRKEADPTKVSDNAKKRGMPQFGTLGSGNHFLEIQKVEEIYEPEIAKAFGIDKVGQITIMIHCGSRGYGHQVASDYLKIFEDAVRKYNIKIPDKQLACAPLTSQEGQDYLKAMYCAVNYAWNNRQVIMHWTREAFEKIFGKTAKEMEMNLIYDVAHNIAKIEEHTINGEKREVVVHRKGATRAFPAGRPELPEIYKKTGQPVIIPGDMGTASYLLVGTEAALEWTFGSTCHGSGRVMSRAAAKKKYSAEEVKNKLEAKGEVIMSASKDGLVEEAPGAYKRIDDVIESVELAGISKKVAKVVPLGVIKG